MGTFANKTRLTYGWYILTKSRKLKKKSKLKVNVSFLNLLLIRDKKGKISCFENTCPHMGGDLPQGKMKNNCIECPFHKWNFNSEGKSVKAYKNEKLPNHKLKKLNIIERFGYIWVYLGDKILFDIPTEINLKNKFTFSFPKQIIKNHPHIIIGNGLNEKHYETLHNLILYNKKINTKIPYELTFSFTSKTRKFLLNFLAPKGLVMSFNTIEGNIAISRITSPIKAQVMFTGKPNKNGNCTTNTIVSIEKNKKILKSIILLYLLLKEDSKILNNLKFRNNFINSDNLFKRYYEIINNLSYIKNE